MKIYKYTLSATDHQPLPLPVGSKILSVANQYDNMVLYAIVTESETQDMYDIMVKGTAHDLPDNVNDYQFLGTVKLMGGKLMFHVFYKRV